MEVGSKVITKKCHRVLDGLGMPDEWAVGIVVPVFSRKGDIRTVVAMEL